MIITFIEAIILVLAVVLLIEKEKRLADFSKGSKIFNVMLRWQV